MEMIVTRDPTPLRAISTAANTGRPTRTNAVAGIALAGSRPASDRPPRTKTIAGDKIVPNAPIGSRRKILISSHVSFQSPRNMGRLVANGMAGQFQENVFQVGQHRAEVGDPNPILGETLNHLGHQIVALALNRESGLLPRHPLDARDRTQTFFGPWIFCR